MPLIIPTNSISAVGYDVANSLRFDDGSSDYLNRTFASSGNRKTFTISTWFKRSGIGTQQEIISSHNGGNDEIALRLNSTNELRFYNYQTSGTNFNLQTNQVLRDTSAWYHVVLAVDTTQATSSNRIKIYLNGEQITSFSSETYPNQNIDLNWNMNNLHFIGLRGAFTNDYFDGYLAEVVNIDGTALDPTSFGEFDADTGIWKPIDVSGLTFGTNGFYLDFELSGSLGSDVSGNGNNWTLNNLTSIDQTTDTPTNNYCTWNPLINTNGVVYSEGNLKANLNGNTSWYRGVASSYAVSQGKWYWEIKQTSSSIYNVNGVVREDNFGWFTGAGSTYLYNRNMTALQSNGKPYTDGSAGSVISAYAYTTGDILMFALDMTNRKMYIGKNGTWFNSGNPSSGTGEIFDSSGFTLGYAYSPSFLGYDVSTDPIVEANFGNPPYSANGYSDANGYGNMSYSVPNGYYILNTKNLAEYG